MIYPENRKLAEDYRTVSYKQDGQGVRAINVCGRDVKVIEDFPVDLQAFYKANGSLKGAGLQGRLEEKLGLILKHGGAEGFLKHRDKEEEQRGIPVRRTAPEREDRSQLSAGGALDNAVRTLEG